LNSNEIRRSFYQIVLGKLIGSQYVAWCSCSESAGKCLRLKVFGQLFGMKLEIDQIFDERIVPNA